MKWIYRENLGVMVNGEEEKELNGFFNADKPKDSKKLTVISVHRAKQLVTQSLIDTDATVKKAEANEEPKKRGRKPKLKEE